MDDSILSSQNAQIDVISEESFWNILQSSNISDSECNEKIFNVVETNPTPTLRFLVPPAPKFRFRYQSEKGSHGSIAGLAEDTNSNRKCFPTVKLENYASPDNVYIKVSLYNDSVELKPHIFQLAGKDSKDGYSIKKLNKKFVAEFPHLCVMAKKIDEVESELISKRKKVNKRKNIDKLSIKEERKTYSFHSVKLYFEAIDGNNTICSIFSEPIKNQKTDDLQIFRISHCSGTCKGGDDVILLCSKVKKENIKIIFSEKNGAWEEEGNFKADNVHFQVAIPFKTPVYKQNVDAEVEICLLRISDNRRGNVVSFRYIQDSDDMRRKRKRSNESCSTVQSEQTCVQDTEEASASGFSSDDYVDGIYEAFPEPFSDLSCSDLIKEALNGPFSPWNTTYLFEPKYLVPDAIPVNLDAENEDTTIPNNFLQAKMLANSNTFSTTVTTQNDLFHSKNIQQSKTSPLHEVSNINLSQNQNLPLSKIPDVKNISMTTYDDNNEIKGEMMCESQNYSNLFSFARRGYELYPKQNSLISSLTQILRNQEDSLARYLKALAPVQDDFGNTLLHLAIKENNWNLNLILQMLKVTSEEVINMENDVGKTAIFLATENNQLQIIKHLLLFGGNPNLIDDKGNNCFHIAVENNFPECLRVLLTKHRKLKHVPDIDSINNQGFSPLHLAILNDCQECLKLLLYANADVNACERKGGLSPLHLAIEHQPSAISLLINHPNIHIQCTDYSGITPLELACGLKCVSFDDLSPGLKVKQSKTAEFIQKLFTEDGPSNNNLDEEITNSYRTEKILCKFLNANSEWKKLGCFIGLSDEEMCCLEKLDNNPSNRVLAKAKETTCYSTENVLAAAGLEKAANLYRTLKKGHNR